MFDRKIRRNSNQRRCLPGFVTRFQIIPIIDGSHDQHYTARLWRVRAVRLSEGEGDFPTTRGRVWPGGRQPTVFDSPSTGEMAPIDRSFRLEVYQGKMTSLAAVGPGRDAPYPVMLRRRPT